MGKVGWDENKIINQMFFVLSIFLSFFPARIGIIGKVSLESCTLLKLNRFIMEFSKFVGFFNEKMSTTFKHFFNNFLIN